MDVNILWVILVGIIVGFLARLLMPGRDPIGFIMTAVIGIAGALIGTYLWTAFSSRTAITKELRYSPESSSRWFFSSSTGRSLTGATAFTNSSNSHGA